MIHIHNGDALEALARRSGIEGEHYSFRESLTTGPVIPDDDWIETRARALSSAYGHDLLRVRTDLVEQDTLLRDAASRGEIVLWFEHDLFCLVHLVYLIQRLGDSLLSLVWCPTPLAQLDERELHLRWESRAAVLPSMIAAAREAWRAYTSPDPLALNDVIGRDHPDFPFLREGFTLHASRFPSPSNGLGALEQRALSLVAAGAIDFATIFPQLDPAAPRWGFGDWEMLRMLRDLATRTVPLIAVTDIADQSPPNFMLTITPAGENVLRGEVDELTVNEPDRWLGGAHLTKPTIWRWDEAAKRIRG